MKNHYIYKKTYSPSGKFYYGYHYGILQTDKITGNNCGISIFQDGYTGSGTAQTLYEQSNLYETVTMEKILEYNYECLARYMETIIIKESRNDPRSLNRT